VARVYSGGVERSRAMSKDELDPKDSMTAEEFFAYLDKLEEEDAENKNS
jgi:hypothetical protein